MYHHVENLTDTAGNVRKGWSVDLYAVGGDPTTASPITIYADAACTMPITRAVAAGLYATVDFYVTPGSYSKRAYDTNGLLQSHYENLSFGAADSTLIAGQWVSYRAFNRVRMTGTGTVTIDAKDSLGNVTSAAGQFTLTGETNRIEYPYFGDETVSVRATLTGTTTAELI